MTAHARSRSYQRFERVFEQPDAWGFPLGPRAPDRGLHVNFLDRQLLAIVARDVKAELALSDTQLAILLGPAFVLCFTLASFVLARVADRGSRKWVLTIGLAAWSLFTAGCGVATTFAQLARLRQ